MIKFAFEKSILYLCVMGLIYFIRLIEMELIYKYFSFDDSIIYTFLMALGEIIGGLFVYYFIHITSKKTKKMSYLLKKLIGNKLNKKRIDGWFKIIILIILASFFDFEEFIILNDFLSKIKNISISLNSRLDSFSTFISTLLCFYALNYKKGRHQIFSIINIAIFFVITFIIEIIYSTEYNKFLLAFFLNVINLILYPFTDAIERYLGYTNFSNPYGIIAAEGVCTFIMTTFYSIGKNPFGQIKKLYEDLSTGKFVLLVFLLLIYVILSGIINIYKIHCNIFWSPAAKGFVNYFFNPIYLIYTFLCENDFIYKGKQNITYFILNEILSFIFIFLGFVYNEYIILSCFGLEHDTKYGIVTRANNSTRESIHDLQTLVLDDEDANSDD